VAADIVENCRTGGGLEDKFIDLAFESRRGAGHDARRHQAVHPLHRRLAAAPAGAAGGVRGAENPLPWLQSLLSGVEHANFFEARSTEYSKAATRGQWHGDAGVWGAFDRLMAKRTDQPSV
jgi:ribonucleoside-diphosphate reductase beta chain